MSLLSDSRPNNFADAPVAMINASADNSSFPTLTSNGRRDKSTDVTSPNNVPVPKRSACFLNSSMSSGPKIPLGKPG